MYHVFRHFRLMDPVRLIGVILYSQWIFDVLAYYKLPLNGTPTASLSSTYSDFYNASNAIDNQTTQLQLINGSCSRTFYQNETAWLRINLTAVYSIKSVKLFYRNDSGSSTSSLQDYYIRVTNSSDSSSWNESQICYRDPGNEKLPVINEQECHREGQYVWILNDNATDEDAPYVHLEICEVEIKGCEVNEYGKDCIFCGQSCEVCDIIEGCTNCSGNFTGSKCEDCLPGHWNKNDSCQICPKLEIGYNCSGNCSEISNASQTCFNGTRECACQTVLIGKTCNDSCKNYNDSENCMYNCTRSCGESEDCHHGNISCTNGCSNGMEGNQCNSNESNSDIDQTKMGNSLSLAPAAIGASISALVMLILIGSLLLLYKRFRQKQQVEESMQQEKYNSSSDSNMTTSCENPSFTESLHHHDEITNCYTSRSFSVAEISKVIAEKSKDNYNIFQSEYKAIPYGEQIGIPCTIGKEERHLEKNRFKSLYPYDHSRISLRDKHDDYIHANYIQNVNNEKAYIASQGPKKNTLDDFWAMVFQENVSIIVMLTNLVEGRKRKCEKYWPAERGSDALYGQIRVHFINEKQYANYIIRSFRVNILEKLDRCSHRAVTQFHYTQWPDHGVPDPISLVLFHKHVKRVLEKTHIKWPLLVHCSAGVGRSGTFIALDALHQQGLDTGVLNVAEYVRKMREDRMNMVQNVDQYICLHIALMESFQGCSVVMSKAIFMTKVQNIHQQNEETSFWITSQFNELISIKKIINENENTARIENGDLILTQNMIDRNSVAVMTPSAKDRLDYYDATFLATFYEKDMLIAAPYPQTRHPVDLITLLVDQESCSVVFINPLTDIPSCAELLTQQKTDIGPYEVQQEESAKISVNLRRRKIKIRKNEQTKWMVVHMYELLCWGADDILPSDFRALSDVIKHIRLDLNKRSERTPITVLSKDGATGCGIFCAVYNAIQQLQQDNEVDMFTIVRKLQRQRPEMISSEIEYRACHDVTLLCLQDIELEIQQEDYNATDKDYVNT